MKKLFEKLFCKHKWKSHVKQPVHQVKRDSYGEIILNHEYIDEVLICENCGKIEKIRY